MNQNGASLAIEADRAIRVDPVHLHHLLENLFRNAVEHGDADVTVRIGDLEDRFYVADDGEGIPEAGRDDVFEADYTTEANGIGLELTFVAHLAAAYDWTALSRRANLAAHKSNIELSK